MLGLGIHHQWSRYASPELSVDWPNVYFVGASISVFIQLPPSLPPSLTHAHTHTRGYKQLVERIQPKKNALAASPIPAKPAWCLSNLYVGGNLICPSRIP